MDTYSEAWRRECEIRWLIKRTPEEIKRYLASVEKHRGKEAAERLKNDAREAYKLANHFKEKK